MGIQNTYSLARDGNNYISTNFRIREFACQDGSDEIPIDDELVIYLQNIRNHFGKSITITSGYRTKSHNTKVGGADNSRHLYGRAADFVVSGVSVR